MKDIIHKKTILLSAISIMCVVVGIAYGIKSKDKILMIMSVIICGVNIFKVLELRSIYKHNKYIVISGRCLESIYKIAENYRMYRILSCDDVIEISVPKNIKLSINEEYNLYFKQSNLVSGEYGAWIKNKILSECFLGYEKINHETEK